MSISEMRRLTTLRCFTLHQFLPDLITFKLGAMDDHHLDKLADAIVVVDDHLEKLEHSIAQGHHDQLKLLGAISGGIGFVVLVLVVIAIGVWWPHVSPLFSPLFD